MRFQSATASGPPAVVWAVGCGRHSAVSFRDCSQISQPLQLHQSACMECLKERCKKGIRGLSEVALFFLSRSIKLCLTWSSSLLPTNADCQVEVPAHLYPLYRSIGLNPSPSVIQVSLSFVSRLNPFSMPCTDSRCMKSLDSLALLSPCLLSSPLFPPLWRR